MHCSLSIAGDSTKTPPIQRVKVSLTTAAEAAEYPAHQMLVQGDFRVLESEWGLLI